MSAVCNEPVDWPAIQADEALLNDPELFDSELARALVAWRRDVESEPSGDLVSVEVASVVIAQARRSHRMRHVLSVVRRLMGGQR